MFKFAIDSSLFHFSTFILALSIQAHPDKKLAEQLHKSQPKLYTDPNHKPEMAIALTPFEALCEFRSLDDIQENIRNFPEFSALLGSESNAFLNLANNSDEKLQQDKLKGKKEEFNLIEIKSLKSHYSIVYTYDVKFRTRLRNTTQEIG